MKLIVTILLLSVLSVFSEINEPEFIWEKRTNINELTNVNSESFGFKYLYYYQDTIFVQYSYSISLIEGGKTINFYGLIKFNEVGKLISNYENIDTLHNSFNFYLCKTIFKKNHYRTYFFTFNQYALWSRIHLREYSTNFKLLNDYSKEKEILYNADNIAPNPNSITIINDNMYFTHDTVYKDKKGNIQRLNKYIYVLDSVYNRNSIDIDTNNINDEYDKAFSPGQIFKFDENHLIYSFIGPKIDSENKYLIICITDLYGSLIKHKKIIIPDYSLLGIKYLGSIEDKLIFYSAIKPLDSDDYVNCIINLDEDLNLTGFEILPDDGFTERGNILLEDRKQILQYGLLYDENYADDYGWWYAYRVLDLNGNLLGTYRWFINNNENDVINHALYLGNDELLTVGSESAEVYLAKIKLPDLSNITDKVDNKILKIYPNPANDFIKIETNNSLVLLGSTCKIINLDGKLIDEFVVSNETININIKNYTNGTYFISITDSNKNTYTQKFIIN